MKQNVSCRFYGWIDPMGRVVLPAEFLDRVEDLEDPVCAKVFVYVALKKKGSR